LVIAQLPPLGWGENPSGLQLLVGMVLTHDCPEQLHKNVVLSSTFPLLEMFPK